MTVRNQPTALIRQVGAWGLDSGDDAPPPAPRSRPIQQHIERVKDSTGPRFEARQTGILGCSSHKAGYNHEVSHQGLLAAEVVY